MYKMKVRKGLCMMVAAVFMFSAALAGCGSSEVKQAAKDSSAVAAASSESTQAAQSTAMEEKKLDFVELQWYTGIPIEPRPNEANVMAEVNKQLKEKLNCSIKFNFIEWGSLSEKMNVMIAAGDPFDLVTTGKWFNFMSNVKKGAYIPIDDLLNQYGKDILGQVPENAWQAVQMGGKKYAIINPSTWATPSGMTFKKDLVEKYGFDYKNAHTLQDLEPYLKLLKEKEPGITPVCAGTNGAPAFGDYGVADDSIVTHLISYNTETNKLEYWWDSALFMKDAKTMNDYYKKGYVRKDAATKKDWVNEWKTGKYAVAGCMGVYDETGTKSTANSGFPCVESFWAQNPMSTGNIQFPVTAIGKNCTNPERAIMFANLLFADKKFFNTVCYGIEGQDYKVVSGAGTDNPTVETNSPQTWAIWHPWVGSLWNQWPSNWNSAEALANMKKQNDVGKVSPILGFVFDPEPVNKEIAQLNTIVAEMGIMTTGMMPDFDKYVADLKDRSLKNGIEKVMAEAQKQLDEWKAAK